MQKYKITVHPYDWFEKDDVEEQILSVNAWCLNKESKPCLVRFEGFQPAIYIELPRYIRNTPIKWTTSNSEAVFKAICKKMEYSSDHPPVSYEVAYMDTLYYYKNKIKSPMLKLYFATRASIPICKRKLGYPIFVENFYNEGHHESQLKVKVWEDNISSIRQFLTKVKGKYSQWFEVIGYKPDEEDKISKLENEFIADIDSFRLIELAESKEWMIYPRILVFDIETYSDNHKAMPIKTMAKHVCYMVSCIYQQIGLPNTRKRILILMGDMSDVDDKNRDTEIILVKNEEQFLMEFNNVIAKYDPEIMSGFNILEYDYDYLNARLARLVKEWGSESSRLKDTPPYFYAAPKWKSSAYGHTELKYIIYPGRINVDMFPIIKRGYKLSKYDLNTVSNKFLERGKHDVKAKEMFEIYELLDKWKGLYQRCIIGWIMRNGKSLDEKLYSKSCKEYEPIYHSNIAKELIQNVVENYEQAKNEMRKVSMYCIEDSELVLDLVEKLNIWIALTESSNIWEIAITEIYTRGQQIRALNQFYDELESMGIVLNSYPANPESKYTGGYVGTPLPGLHDMVGCLDFSSLYPSIMIGYNICHSTFVRPEDYSIVPIENCNVINCEVYDKNGNLVATNVHRFIKPEFHQGYIPRLLKKLLAKRSEVKLALEQEVEGSLAYMLLNERQLAIKASANSLYGVLGVRVGGVFPLLEAAECVTSKGRENILFCNEYLATKYGAKIIYNDTDSVMFSLPFVKTYEEGIEWTIKLGKEISALMPPPMKLEFEKIGKIFLIKKKHYAYWQVDINKKIKDEITGQIIPNPDYGKLRDFRSNEFVVLKKGIILARRDNCKHLRKLYQEMLYMIFEGADWKTTLKYLITECVKLYQGKVDWGDLVVIRSLGSNYKSDSYFMKVFGDEIARLGLPANPGDRLEYLVVKTNDSKELLGKRMRLPETYLSRCGTDEEEKLDTVYYLGNLFIKPLQTLWQIGYQDDIRKIELENQKRDHHNILSEICLKGDNYMQIINMLWQHYLGDTSQIIEYLKNSPDSRLRNAYVLAKRKHVSGRSVLQATVTKEPIKKMIKAIQNGVLPELVENLIDQNTRNELFGVN